MMTIEEERPEMTEDEKLENERLEKALIRLYRAITAIQTVAIDFVREGANPKERLNRAEAVLGELKMNSLQTMIKSMEVAKDSAPQMLSLNINDCEGGCWDPVTEQCVC